MHTFPRLNSVQPPIQKNVRVYILFLFSHKYSTAHTHAQDTEFIHNPVFQSKTFAVAVKACTDVGGYKKGLFVCVLRAFMKAFESEFVPRMGSQEQGDRLRMAKES